MNDPVVTLGAFVVIGLAVLLIVGLPIVLAVAHWKSRRRRD